MRTVLTTLFAILLFVLGCWTPGDIQENLPKHRDKFPSGTTFFVEKTEPRVMKALVDALKARGFKVTDDRAKAAVAQRQNRARRMKNGFLMQSVIRSVVCMQR